MNYLEEFEIESSWISINSLKKQANISTLIENCQVEHTLPINLSTCSDIKSSKTLSESVSYNNLQFSKPKPHPFPSPAKFIQKIQKLNEEIVILSQQLKLSNKEIERLNTKLTLANQENTIKLQFMQEQHEKRLQKSKSDIDFLLKDMNMKSCAIIAQEFLQKHSEEIENLKEFYEKQLESLKAHYESDLIFKDMEQERNLNEVKQKFFRYVSEIEKRFKKELTGLRFEYSRELVEMQKELQIAEKFADLASDEEVSTGFDFDCEFGKKNGISEDMKNKLKLKISITDFIERLSCESSASTRRESR